MIFVMCPQNSFLDPQGSVYLGERAEILKVRMVDYLSEFQNERKIFFREKHAEADQFFSNDVTHSVVNTPDFHIVDCLKKYADVIFDKTRYSGFFNTGLDDFLKKERITQVSLIGLETHTSILFTAEELRNRGIDVKMIEPLTASRQDHLHNVSISLMANHLGVHIGS